MKKIKINTILTLTILFFTGMLTACGGGNSSSIITASQVEDRESLKRFVNFAKYHLESSNYTQAREDFSKDPGPWRHKGDHGAIYLFIIDMRDEKMLFHPDNPSLERMSNINTEGEGNLRKRFILVGKRGGGFEEYNFHDSHTGTNRPKISYIAPIEIDGKKNYIIVSGFYVD